MRKFQMYNKIYQLNGWQDTVNAINPEYITDLAQTISTLSYSDCYNKKSEEKTKKGRTVLRPKRINRHFEEVLGPLGYRKKKLHFLDVDDPEISAMLEGLTLEEQQKLLAKLGVKGEPSSEECDFYKEGLMGELQLAKYAFFDTDVQKSELFHRLGYAKACCVIVPMKSMLRSMSSGPAWFGRCHGKMRRSGLASKITCPFALIGIDLVDGDEVGTLKLRQLEFRDL